MKTVKSRKIRNKGTKPAISFDKPSVFETSSSDENVVKSKVRKRKVVENDVSNSDSNKSNVKSFHRVRKRKLKNYVNLANTFLVERKSTIHHQVFLDELDDEMDKKIESDERLSVGLIILILSICLVVGFLAGYMAYRLIFT